MPRTRVHVTAAALAVLVALTGAFAPSSQPAGATSENWSQGSAGHRVPRWKILVLSYPETEFTFTDATGTTRHFQSTIDPHQQRRVTVEAKKFVRQDIPALDSGAMVPTLSVRTPRRPLTDLAPYGTGFWPSPAATTSDRDPRFDAVIVIWNPVGIDALSGERLDITPTAGLTPAMGTGQTYATAIVQAVTDWGNRNTLKHEFGHSILSYFKARGAGPEPAVDNHTDPDTYVHCGTATPYVWLDESTDNPIPNSIYNNSSGFTHDYYSGTTALASDPTSCLGITPETWASGSPTEPTPHRVSH